MRMAGVSKKCVPGKLLLACSGAHEAAPRLQDLVELRARDLALQSESVSFALRLNDLQSLSVSGRLISIEINVFRTDTRGRTSSKVLNTLYLPFLAIHPFPTAALTVTAIANEAASLRGFSIGGSTFDF